jgi:hypothetical protein
MRCVYLPDDDEESERRMKKKNENAREAMLVCLILSMQLFSLFVGEGRKRSGVFIKWQVDQRWLEERVCTFHAKGGGGVGPTSDTYSHSPKLLFQSVRTDDIRLENWCFLIFYTYVVIFFLVIIEVF